MVSLKLIRLEYWLEGSPIRFGTMWILLFFIWIICLTWDCQVKVSSRAGCDKDRTDTVGEDFPDNRYKGRATRQKSSWRILQVSSWSSFLAEV
jgi:hypothetical protein